MLIPIVVAITKTATSTSIDTSSLDMTDPPVDSRGSAPLAAAR